MTVFAFWKVNPFKILRFICTDHHSKVQVFLSMFLYLSNVVKNVAIQEKQFLQFCGVLLIRGKNPQMNSSYQLVSNS